MVASKIALTDELAGIISFKKFAHDKFKLSIYPQRPKFNRRFQNGHLRLISTESSWKKDYGCSLEKSGVYERYSRAFKNAASSLDSSEKFQEGVKDKPGYGSLPRQKRLSRYAADRIGEVGHLGWQKYGSSGVVLTGTRPGSEEFGEKTYMSFSGQIVAWIRQWIRDVTKNDCTVFFVWEPHKKGRCHIHLAVLTKNQEAISQLLEGWFFKWFDCLNRISKLSGVDLFKKNDTTTWKNTPRVWQSDAQILKSNPARYFAKYVTKEARSSCQKAKFCPSRWWGCDRKTAAEANKARLNFVLGGYTISELKPIFAKLIAGFEGFASKALPFSNPVAPELGGSCLFVDEKFWKDCILRAAFQIAEYRRNADLYGALALSKR